MRKLLALVLIVTVWVGFTPSATAAAQNTHLVPCRDSPIFRERMQEAPNNYYFEGPNQSYADNLLCGPEDGLPHLQLRFDRAIDIIIPFAIFFYFAGFVGWSGRSYLIGSKRASKPEESEIFIDIPLAIRSFTQGLLWPLLFFKEVTTRELTVRNHELTVSPR
jgi:photosystem I subunit 3